MWFRIWPVVVPWAGPFQLERIDRQFAGTRFACYFPVVCLNAICGGYRPYNPSIIWKTLHVRLNGSCP
jgi:hypothetical protein